MAVIYPEDNECVRIAGISPSLGPTNFFSHDERIKNVKFDISEFRLITSIKHRSVCFYLDLENLLDIEILGSEWAPWRLGSIYELKFIYDLDFEPTSKNKYDGYKIELYDFEVECLIETLQKMNKDEIGLKLLLGTMSA